MYMVSPDTTFSGSKNVSGINYEAVYKLIKAQVTEPLESDTPTQLKKVIKEVWNPLVFGAISGLSSSEILLPSAKDKLSKSANEKLEDLGNHLAAVYLESDSEAEGSVPTTAPANNVMPTTVLPSSPTAPFPPAPSPLLGSANTLNSRPLSSASQLAAPPQSQHGQASSVRSSAPSQTSRFAAVPVHAREVTHELDSEHDAFDDWENMYQSSPDQQSQAIEQVRFKIMFCSLSITYTSR
jgi:hypothetical protein